MLFDWPGRAEQRVAALEESCLQVRERTAAWLSERGADPAFARFTGHFEAFGRVLGGLLDRLDEELARVSPAAGSGSVYDRCRALEEGLLVVRRAAQWYIERYDQRLDDRWAGVLAAADEVVRSCWQEAFERSGSTPPAGPLLFVDPRWGACANLRTAVPPDLRGPADGVLTDLLAALPVPTIALPPACGSWSWWLVLAPHETGHHVMHDVAGLAAEARGCLAGAVPAEDAGRWLGWSDEVFADAYAAAMIGEAAGWGIGELEFGPPARLARVPEAGDRYPPPLVRVALIDEVATRVATGRGAGSAAAAADWLAGQSLPAPNKAVVGACLAATPAVAAALASLLSGASDNERSRSWFADGGRVDDWARQLLDGDPHLYPHGNRPAARLALAAGLAAYRGLGPALPGDERVAALHDTLVAALRRCGPAGVLAPGASAAPVDAVVHEFGDRLFAAGDLGEARR